MASNFAAAQGDSYARSWHHSIFYRVFSGKVMAKLKNSFVLLTGYTCYENLQSSCRLVRCFTFLRLVDTCQAL